MSSTTNTDIVEVDPNQLGKAATVNTGLEAVDRMLGEVKTLDVTALTSPYALVYQATGDEPISDKTALRFAHLRVIGTASGDFTIQMPASKSRLFSVQNSLTSNFNVFMGVAGGLGVFVPPGAVRWLISSGVDVIPIAPPVWPGVSGAVLTVSALPAASSALRGARAIVSDATAPTFAGTLTGGGAVVCPVYCDGAAWRAG